MKNFEGMKWGELTVNEKEMLLKNANCVDETGNDTDEGECIVDLTEEYSIAGKRLDDEIIIDDNAIIYNPAN